MSRAFAAMVAFTVVVMGCTSSKDQREPDPNPVDGVDVTSSDKSAESVEEQDAESVLEPASRERTSDEPERGRLVGEYTNQHGMQVVGEGGEWEMSEATDCLSIEKVGAEQMEFAFELYFTNAHTCMMNGVAKRDGSGQWVHIEKRADVDCRLRISVGDDMIQLEDADAGCRAYYCGARGVIDGASFARDTQKDGPGSCGDMQ